MLNMLRADIYRITRGKALYVNLVVLILFNIMVVGTQSIAGINFSIAWESMGITPPEIGFDGLGSAALLYTRLDNTIFFLLSLVCIAGMSIFTCNTVKNDISFGISRAKLYLSKLVLSVGLCVLLVLFYMGTGMLMATFLRGFGGPAPAGFWLNLFQTLGAQMFAMLAMVCLVNFLIFAFRCSGSVIAMFFAICFAPTMIVGLIMLAFPGALRFLELDLMFTINRLGFFSQLGTRTVIASLAVSALYMVATTLGGIALFRRAEIK